MAVPQKMLDEFAVTAGKTITCKAAVAWEAKKPLDITDILVSSKHPVTCPCHVAGIDLQVTELL